MSRFAIITIALVISGKVCYMHGCDVLEKDGREIACYDNEVNVSDTASQLVRRVVFHGTRLNWGEVTVQFPRLEIWRCFHVRVECVGDVPLGDRAACICSSMKLKPTPTLAETSSSTDGLELSTKVETTTSLPPLVTGSIRSTTTHRPFLTIIKKILEDSASSVNVTTTTRSCAAPFLDHFASLSWDCIIKWSGGVGRLAGWGTLGVLQVILSFYGFVNLAWTGTVRIKKVSFSPNIYICILMYARVQIVTT